MVEYYVSAFIKGLFQARHFLSFPVLASFFWLSSQPFAYVFAKPFVFFALQTALLSLLPPAPILWVTLFCPPTHAKKNIYHTKLYAGGGCGRFLYVPAAPTPFLSIASAG